MLPTCLIDYLNSVPEIEKANNNHDEIKKQQSLPC